MWRVFETCLMPAMTPCATITAAPAVTAPHDCQARPASTSYHDPLRLQLLLLTMSDLSSRKMLSGRPSWLPCLMWMRLMATTSPVSTTRARMTCAATAGAVHRVVLLSNFKGCMNSMMQVMLCSTRPCMSHLSEGSASQGAYVLVGPVVQVRAHGHAHHAAPSSSPHTTRPGRKSAPHPTPTPALSPWARPS